MVNRKYWHSTCKPSYHVGAPLSSIPAQCTVMGCGGGILPVRGRQLWEVRIVDLHYMSDHH